MSEIWVAYGLESQLWTPVRTCIVFTTFGDGSLSMVSTQRRPTTVPSPYLALAQLSSVSLPGME